MSGFKQCPNGHYYSEELYDYCPYCNDGRFRLNAKTFPIMENAKALYDNANVSFPLDVAPDGVQRIVNIERERFSTNIVREITSGTDLEKDELPTDVLSHADAINKFIHSELLKKDIVRYDTADLHGDYYVFPEKVKDVFPETLLTQMLDKQSVFFHSDKTDIGSNTAVGERFRQNDVNDDRFYEERKKIETDKYLAISIDDGTLKLLSIPDRKQPWNYTSQKTVIYEDLSALKPTILKKEPRGWITEVYDERLDKEIENRSFYDAYLETLTFVANNSSYSLLLYVSRQEIAERLITLLPHLAEIHHQGFVHCDLKPQNILCTKEGFVPIDSLNVQNGCVSVGFTEKYCAPEQILATPVTPATDIYSLGLLLLSVRGGAVIYGRTSDFVIPIGAQKTKNVKLITEPKVFIDREKSNIENVEGIPHWQSFLERCLAFEQGKRFQNIETFAGEYKRLIGKYPLRNSIKFSPNFGNLTLATQSNGNVKAVWVIGYDARIVY